MLTTGIDIEDISRFKDKNEKFLNRIFTKNELDYCYKYKNYHAHLCARFCAKEAVVKALSVLYSKIIPYNKIEILNHDNGVPYVNILIDELKKYSYSLSISHEHQKAAAVVVVESENKK